MKSSNGPSWILGAVLFLVAGSWTLSAMRGEAEMAFRAKERKALRELGKAISDKLLDPAVCTRAITNIPQTFDWSRARGNTAAKGLPIRLDLDSVGLGVIAGEERVSGQNLTLRQVSLTDSIPIAKSEAAKELYFFAQLSLSTGEGTVDRKVAVVLPVVDMATMRIKGCTYYDAERAARCARKSRIYVREGADLLFDDYGGRDSEGCVARGAVIGPALGKR